MPSQFLLMSILAWTKQDRGQKKAKKLQARELSRQMGELLMLRPEGYSLWRTEFWPWVSFTLPGRSVSGNSRCDVNLHTDILDTPDIFWDEAAKPGFGLSWKLKENMGPQNLMVKWWSVIFLVISWPYLGYILFSDKPIYANAATMVGVCWQLTGGATLMIKCSHRPLLDFQERFEKIYVACRTYLDIVTWILIWIWDETRQNQNTYIYSVPYRSHSRLS